MTARLHAAAGGHIDALDELPPAAGTLGAVLRLLSPPRSRLPPWVRLFVTSRDETAIKRERLSAFTPTELRVDEARNVQDVRARWRPAAPSHFGLSTTHRMPPPIACLPPCRSHPLQSIKPSRLPPRRALTSGRQAGILCAIRPMQGANPAQ